LAIADTDKFFGEIYDQNLGLATVGERLDNLFGNREITTDKRLGHGSNK